MENFELWKHGSLKILDYAKYLQKELSEYSATFLDGFTLDFHCSKPIVAFTNLSDHRKIFKSRFEKVLRTCLMKRLLERGNPNVCIS